MSTKVKFKLTDVEQNSCEDIMWIFACNTLLTYPDSNKKFEIYTNASDIWLGSVIRKEVKPISFYSIKLTKPQKGYKLTKKELRNIIEALKWFQTILLGWQLKIYTKYKILLVKNWESIKINTYT